ncbi:MAG: 3-hydroxyacyl-CoA dehydrogenase/enoyl-CoA hydratase family protein, partial [Armatimonadetes bacterium]|nr:3-hydroxyacyl-CoA dehydrogenase/enoyl-CoA hydratase family protein [Armatimonadota bacterium]
AVPRERRSARAHRAQPPAFTAPDAADLVSIGNIEDHLPKVAEADWVIEAITERLDTKQALMARLEAACRPDAIVSTNTSGLSIRGIAEGRSEAFRRRFLGTHFFNPPRYVCLLELIPGADTSPDVLQIVEDFAAHRLGKGIVRAHDTPGFIANRMGTHGFMLAVRLMMEHGLAVEEVDELTGTLLGRPRSATFRTADLVGLDVTAAVADHLTRHLPDDEAQDVFAPPPFVRDMIARGWLGEKSGGGFYRRVGGEIWTLDWERMEYRPRRRPSLPAVEMLRGVHDSGQRLRRVVAGEGRESRFLWDLLSRTLAYAARRVPEIADDIVSVDRATRWGYRWEMGPFQTWDALDVAGIARRLEQEGREVPTTVRAVLSRGAGTFYRWRDGGEEHFDPREDTYRPLKPPPRTVALHTVKARRQVVASNPGASLLDLGDGVSCLEFHSRLNTIGEDILDMLRRSLDEVDARFDALVIGNEAADFSAGANLLLLLMQAQEGNWVELEWAVRRFQNLLVEVRYFPKPVVAAPRGRTLAGGCEICLACPHVQAAGETYMGLVESGAGLIPAGGGTAEMAWRAAACVPSGVPADLLPFMRSAFETVAMARVSTSAQEARRLGFLRATDRITPGEDHLLFDARQAALRLLEDGYAPPAPRRVRVVGERGRAALEAAMYNLRVGGHITEYDEHVGRRLAYVMTGGPAPEDAQVSEAHLLDLEREAFLSLLGEPRTQARMEHLLETGRPLRN